MKAKETAPRPPEKGRGAWYKTALLYAFLMHLALLVPAAIAPAFKKAFSDNVLSEAAKDWLLPIFVTMFAAAIVSGAAAYLQKQCLMLLSDRIETAGAENYMRDLLSSSPRGAGKTAEFKLLSKIDAGKSAARFLTRDFLDLCFAAVSIAIYLPLMFREDVFMTFAALTLAVASIALTFVRHTLTPKYAGGRAAGGDWAALENRAKRVGLSGIMDMSAIKASALEGSFFSALITARNKAAAAGLEEEKNRAYEPFDAAGEIVFMNLLLFASAIRITQRNFTVGSYLAFQAYAAMLFSPIWTLFSAGSVLRGLKSKLAFLNAGKKQPEERGAEEDGVISGYTLRAEGVRLPSGGENRMPPLDFCAAEGAHITVTGGPDADKTALLRLLAGLSHPAAGTVTVGGISPTAVRRLPGADAIIAYAARLPVFFEGTLRDNVSFWDRDVPDEAVLAALSLAGIPASQFAGGLTHRLTDGGRNLSAGEQRRIELARALLHNPKILIVDDILYRLDAESRASIKKELKSRGITLFASAESLSSTADSDEILSLGTSGGEYGEAGEGGERIL
ncbi:MAG: ATP-binding cassette domain-containing protein [Treponema sp.]|jgi:ABC-type bacteriocin/lantibiotic exporter with double-glycine peptidase domain|nr:ATP-binding cassette domain-containing protein [Treponema sp.]